MNCEVCMGDIVVHLFIEINYIIHVDIDGYIWIRW